MSGEAVPSAPCPGSPGTLTGAVTVETGVGDGTGPRTRALVGGMGGCWAHAGRVCVRVPEWVDVYLSVVCVFSCASMYTCLCPSVSVCPVCVCTHGGVCVHVGACVCYRASPGSA